MRTLRPQIALLITPVLLITACQGEPEEPAEEPSPSPVAPAAMEAVDLPDDPEKLAEAVTGRMQEALSVDVRMTVVPEEQEEEEASVEDVTISMLLTDPPSATMTIVDNSEDRPSTAHMIVQNEIVYTTLEEEPLLPDKDWMRLTADEIDAAEEEIGPFTEVFRVMLTETNKSLEAAAGDSSLDVVRLGELEGDPKPGESEDGDAVTVYRGTTSTHDMADAGQKDFKAAVDAGLDEVAWELSVTDKGLPSEFTVEMVTPDGQEAESTVHYSEWGKELEIEAPAEDNVGTIMESLEG